MGLEPLEFSECLTDSPHFRENLHAHEKELKKTSKSIKGLIVELKDLLQATSSLSKAQRSFAKTLTQFHCESVVGQQTEDEIIIEESMSEFGKLMDTIEEERDRMLEQANVSVIAPLEQFRKEVIGRAKEQKRKYAKEVEKFSQLLEKSLSIKQSKVSDVQLGETDNLVISQRYRYLNEAMEYVQLLQEFEERQKFEFVEIILQFTSGWLTFYHQGYEVARDFHLYKQDLSLKLQKCRYNFNSTKEATRLLMMKMLKNPLEHTGMCQEFTREGYLLLLEKKAFSSSWVRVYGQFQKMDNTLVMTSPSAVPGKLSSSENLKIASCIRRASDSIDRRFCFDVTLNDRNSSSLTFQAMSEEDLRMWMDALDGKDPIYGVITGSNKTDSLVNRPGIIFVKRCIAYVEENGIEDVGLYRVVGASTQVAKLTANFNDEQKAKEFAIGQDCDIKAVTSAIKAFFRSLPEPLTTYALYDQLIAAAKMDTKTPDSKVLRVNTIHKLIQQLPRANFEVLEMLIAHLHRVSEHSIKNMMTVSNLGVCFGPTLMWSKDESVAAFLDIKFASLVVEIFIEEYDLLFKTVSDAKSPVLPTPSTGILRPTTPVLAVTNSKPPTPSTPGAPRVPPKPAILKRMAPPLPRKAPPLDSTARNSTPVSVAGVNAAEKTLSENNPSWRTAKALYDCQAGCDSEVSFKKHQIILNVRPSDETGWLFGTVDGKTGLIPENYIWLL